MGCPTLLSLEEDSAIISMATALPSAVKALTRDSITKELTKALGLEVDKDLEDKDSGDRDSIVATVDTDTTMAIMDITGIMIIMDTTDIMDTMGTMDIID
jgi:hypothetical protein